MNRGIEDTKENRTPNQSGSVMSAVLTAGDFRRLGELIYTECGIKMPPQKKIMLEARLKKRLRETGIKSFREYCEYVFSLEGRARELTSMLDVVTTNKTDFFREPRHFDYLFQYAVPELLKLHGAGTKRELSVWSAGCSTGEEPYTIAMVLNEFRERHPSFRFQILATDISTKVLDRAMRGIYGQDKVEGIPIILKKKYLLRSKNRERRQVRVVPELRKDVRFRRLNFMENDFGMREPMDIIFCRNVIIYFDKPTQARLLSRLCDHLVPGGYIFMGHSETLSGLKVPLVSVGPMVYRKPL